MTRDEIIALLSKIRGAYPNTKITDAAGLVDSWELAFFGDDTSEVYKAVRFHLNTSKFFPTVADLREAMKHTAIYNVKQAPLLTGKAELKFENSGCVQLPCPYLKEGQTDFCTNCFEGRAT